MLRPDGYVKVLDFGLAKLSEQASPAVAAEAPTIQVRTGSGIVIGTAGYMSPEQARGSRVSITVRTSSVLAQSFTKCWRDVNRSKARRRATRSPRSSNGTAVTCACRARSSFRARAHR